jgi:hypothetical protein
VRKDVFDNYELEGSLASRRDVDEKYEVFRQEWVGAPSAATTTDFAAYSDENSRGRQTDWSVVALERCRQQAATESTRCWYAEE